MNSVNGKNHDQTARSVSPVRTPRILFVHSNPLVEGLSLLDYEEEEHIIKRCCYESKIGIRFNSQVGTVKALSSSLIHGADIIHYSGHGDRNSIIFEKDNGDIHYLDSKALESLLRASDTACACSLAFVSACYSEEAGNRFIAAGVKHVICVKQNEMISDNSSLTFAKLFYTALFQGKTVKVAFDIALRTVIADESSATRIGSILSPHHRQSTLSEPKYLLLPADDPHDEIIFNPHELSDGTFIDESKPVTINHCDRPPSRFVTRNFELQSAYFYLCASRPRSRLVTIEGGHGIGKSAFLCQLAHHITERAMYEEICFLPLARMLRDYETHTHGDFSAQVTYLISKFASAVSTYRGEDIDDIDDLVRFLESGTASELAVHRPSLSRGHSIPRSDLTRNHSGSLSGSDDSPHSPLWNLNEGNETKSFSNGQSTKRILFVLDGCEAYTQLWSSELTFEGDSSSDLSDCDNISTTSIQSSSDHVPPLLYIIDSLLRKTSQLNFVMSTTRRSSRRKILTSQLSEPEKVVVLKSFSDLKLAELIRKVAPRPLTFSELGITPQNQIPPTEVLSKRPWVKELNGNPRAALYFVRHLSDMHLSDSEEVIALAKSAFEDAIKYREAATPMESSSISSKQSLAAETLQTHSESVIHAGTRKSFNNGRYSSDDSQSMVCTPSPRSSLSQLVKPESSDPSSWRTWIDTLAQTLFTSIFTPQEQTLRSPELVYRLGRQYSEEDRFYLYTAFMARAAMIGTLSSLGSSSSIKEPSQGRSSLPLTATARISTSITSLPASQRLPINNNYIAAQEAYLQWWTPLTTSLRKFRYEFMCSSPIVLYGFCSRYKAEQLLLEENKIGMFLFRFSESKNDGSIVLSSLLQSSPVRSNSQPKSDAPVPFDDPGSLDSQPGHIHAGASLQIGAPCVHVSHHLIQVSEYGVALSFRDHRNTYSSLWHLLEGCDSLKTLYPDIPKSELLSLLEKFARPLASAG